MPATDILHAFIPTRPRPNRAARSPRHAVVIVGAGPVGSGRGDRSRAAGRARASAGRQRQACAVGSRAICLAKRTLEIFDRLGVGERMVDKGVTWKVGRVFHRDREVSSFDLLPEAGHKMPRLHQPAAVLRRAISGRALRGLAARRPDRPAMARTASRPDAAADGVAVEVETPDGRLSAGGRLADRLRRRQVARPRHDGPGVRGPGLRGPLPDRRRRDEGGLPARTLVLVRPPFNPASRRCCTSSPTTSGASTCSSAGTPTGRRGAQPENVMPRASKKMLGRSRLRARLGLASIRSSADGWSIPPRPRDLRRRRRASGLARSARAARTAASRTSTTWRGSWRW